MDGLLNSGMARIATGEDRLHATIRILLIITAFTAGLVLGKTALAISTL